MSADYGIKLVLAAPKNCAMFQISSQLKFIFLATFIGLLSVDAHAINCSLATSKVEKMICGSVDLIMIDKAMDQQYRASLVKAQNSALIKAEQRMWLDQVQSRCGNVDCLKKAYQAQILRLSESMSPWCQKQLPLIPGSWVRAGDAGFFEEFTLGPDGEFDSWLHHRPEILGGAWKLRGCRLEITSTSGLGAQWLLIDVTKSRLRGIEADEPVPGIVSYRAIK